MSHAWLAGIVELECDLDRLRPALEVRGRLPAIPGAVDLARRFAVLLFLDRASGNGDEGRRAEMQSLLPELFEPVLAETRRRERGPGPRLG